MASGRRVAADGRAELAVADRSFCMAFGFTADAAAGGFTLKAIEEGKDCSGCKWKVASEFAGEVSKHSRRR